ncbi:hypothetical protein V6Z12_D03G196500 [Gossypium hirsutum]|uniref:Uncharacterized protein n=2 Tax=Gossypium TaxID=3633 RepID=A0A1U8M2N8_GOSHI|nr:uncharacterized protein LOC107932354 [Gossypium hirsutum]
MQIQFKRSEVPSTFLTQSHSQGHHDADAVALYMKDYGGGFEFCNASDDQIYDDSGEGTSGARANPHNMEPSQENTFTVCLCFLKLVVVGFFVSFIISLTKKPIRNSYAKEQQAEKLPATVQQDLVDEFRCL